MSTPRHTLALLAAALLLTLGMAHAVGPPAQATVTREPVLTGWTMTLSVRTAPAGEQP